MPDEQGNAGQVGNAGQAQQQQQQQQQSLIVNFQNSSNPALESQIFEQHSAGRQLGRITDVLGVVLDALAGNAALTLPVAASAIGNFREMQNQIANLKRDRAPEHFIQQLETLRGEDSAAYDAVVLRLRSWLAALPTP